VIARFFRRSPWHRLPVLVGGALLSLLAVAPLIADEPASDDPQSANSVGEEPLRTGVAGVRSKQEALSFALVMLAGIIMGGAMLLILVLVWGNRARRLARRPLPPVSRRDELWFLKPTKEFGDDPGGVSETGPESEPETK
jgi:hypothetical protein